MERADLGESTTQADPELVAVFDLAGSVDGFLRATAGVAGLEFLADLQEDRVDSDDDFHFVKDDEIDGATVPQTLYMVMTNAQAVGELVRLFALWQADPKVKFETGLNPLKEVFGLLRAIRRWAAEDRVRETGLLEQWAEDLQVVGPQGKARVEIELWYRAEQAARDQAERAVVELVNRTGGGVVTTTELGAIAYHALLAEIPMSAVAAVLESGLDAIELLQANAILMVSPSRPMAFPSASVVPGLALPFDPQLPSGKPRVALLDGLPMANHDALQNRLVVDDADDWAGEYPVQRRSHGSAMASLIIHGDLADPGLPLKEPIYVRPILKPHPLFSDQEVVPNDVLLVDLIHRAIHRMFEGDDSAEPVAPSVRIVNVSVGDPSRVFVRRLSPLARLLDWFAHRYNLVIVVSAGNHDAVSASIAAEALADSPATAVAVSRALHDGARHRRLLSPAEAINVLTVGGTHDDGVDVAESSTVIDPLPAGVPAAYSPVGFGFRRSVKPEILLPGGRQFVQAPPPGLAGDIELRPAVTVGPGPGLAAAAPGLSGETAAQAYSCGTSNAAALAARTLNAIFDKLEALTDDAAEFPFPDAQYHPVLAKTLLVHAAGWHELLPTMRDLLGLSGQATRRELTRILGYGPVRSERVAAARSFRVVLLGAASISADQRRTFQFPLPDSLATSTAWRRLTITLGWLSSVSMQSQKYRGARLWFAPPQEDLAVAPVEADHFAVEKGTVQHQVLEGEAASGFVTGSALEVNVDCRADCGKFAAPVRFGIAASLEVSEAVAIDVHAEVRQRLRQEVQERARAQVAAR